LALRDKSGFPEQPRSVSTTEESSRGVTALRSLGAPRQVWLSWAAAERQHYWRQLPRCVSTTEDSCRGASALRSLGAPRQGSL